MMKTIYIRELLFAVALLCLGLTGLKAQEVSLASGGEAVGTGGSSSYSVGQVVYTTHSGDNGSVAQGVQQAFEISVVTAINQTEDIKLSIYPNPVNNYLFLELDRDLKTNMSYQLIDINGRVLETDKLENKQTRIMMSHLNPSTYFVKIIEGSKAIKTFKVAKQ